MYAGSIYENQFDTFSEVKNQRIDSRPKINGWSIYTPVRAEAVSVIVYSLVETPSEIVAGPGDSPALMVIFAGLIAAATATEFFFL